MEGWSTWIPVAVCPPPPPFTRSLRLASRCLLGAAAAALPRPPTIDPSDIEARFPFKTFVTHFPTTRSISSSSFHSAPLTTQAEDFCIPAPPLFHQSEAAPPLSSLIHIHIASAPSQCLAQCKSRYYYPASPPSSSTTTTTTTPSARWLGLEVAGSEQFAHRVLCKAPRAQPGTSCPRLVCVRLHCAWTEQGTPPSLAPRNRGGGFSLTLPPTEFPPAPA